jgi:4-amino-4-deoxy-L-arabinose transferase-like glycosyltransferase
VVPLSALFSFLLLQRRLRELLHPGFWLPLLGSFALLFLWARDVAHGTDGGENVRALFWDNLVGRFASYSDPSGAVLALGHRNWPGKYLVELPLYLLPWTPLVIGAIVCIGRNRRRRDTMTIATRFALCASVPALCILSIASTSRGIYAAPLIPGIALFVAAVLTRPEPDPQLQRVVHVAFKWTVWVLMVTDGLFITAIAAVDAAHGRGSMAGLVVALAGLAILVAICVSVLREGAVSNERSADIELAVVRLTGAHAVAGMPVQPPFIPPSASNFALRQLATLSP